ncbi:MAG: hypothetical protein M1829_004192 [Trizodia sp. TS-e1964]|nr:MAG: hypothetical protein M1829_004192 [Trizodia sp. TS-e1964]
MPTRPSLQVDGLPSVSEDATSTVFSPGGEARLAQKNALLKNLRPPPTQHVWQFWHDRNQPPPLSSSPAPTASAKAYEDSVLKLGEPIHDIRKFWEIYNNTPLELLKMRDSIHLFKDTVKPVWEDPRNVRGGSWTFRVAKDLAPEFWRDILLFAIGEKLQEACDKGDDICGVSLSIRFTSNLITIWNRDGANRKSVDAVRDVVLAGLSERLRPRPESFWYKLHSEHAGFDEVIANAKKAEVEAKKPKEAEAAVAK